MNQSVKKILDKYYRGETSLEEEKFLKTEILKEKDKYPEEQLVIEYYNQRTKVPDDLEARIFEKIKGNKKIILRRNLIRYISVAAMVIFIVSIVLTKTNQPEVEGYSEEEQFAILEKALYEVSNNIQPQQEEKSLILFQDKNIKIVMN